MVSTPCNGPGMSAPSSDHTTRPQWEPIADQFGCLTISGIPHQSTPLPDGRGSVTHAESATAATEPRPSGSGCPLESRNPQIGYAPGGDRLPADGMRFVVSYS